MATNILGEEPVFGGEWAVARCDVRQCQEQVCSGVNLSSFYVAGVLCPLATNTL